MGLGMEDMEFTRRKANIVHVPAKISRTPTDTLRFRGLQRHGLGLEWGRYSTTGDSAVRCFASEPIDNGRFPCLIRTLINVCTGDR